MKTKALSILKQTFGYDEFRPLQWEIIQNVLEKKDVLALMPTGGGKSICFQIPALILKGTAVVVSPLIALMKDQVDGLNLLGIQARFFNSSLTDQEQIQIIRELHEGRINLLYVSPEKLSQSNFFPTLQTVNISLIAIDEAHCISSWGHDFRPDYTQLKHLKNAFPQTPIIALTATADPNTQKDIVSQLQLKDVAVFTASFLRKNISMEVLSGKNRLLELLEVLKSHKKESGIIYCIGRKSTERLAQKLRENGFKALAYHAGLTNNDRSFIQQKFINDETPIICATIAFGMGIDKSNVRFVIHYNMPKNLEGYYQEIGRSGRDGLPSKTYLFHQLRDEDTIRKMIADAPNSAVQEAKLEKMIDFIQSPLCRNKMILAYFGETLNEDCEVCDNCTGKKTKITATIPAQKLFSTIYRVQQKEPLSVIIEILKGSERGYLKEKKYHQLSTFNIGTEWTFDEWLSYCKQLIQLGYIETDASNNLKLNNLSNKVLFEKQTVELIQSIQKSKKSELTEFNSATENLFDYLKQIRKIIAKQQGIPPYLIFSDATLKEMAIKKPITENSMLAISGVGYQKFKNYGPAFINGILSAEKV